MDAIVLSSSDDEDATLVDDVSPKVESEVNEDAERSRRVSQSLSKLDALNARRRNKSVVYKHYREQKDSLAIDEDETVSDVLPESAKFHFHTKASMTKFDMQNFAKMNMTVQKKHGLLFTKKQSLSLNLTHGLTLKNALLRDVAKRKTDLNRHALNAFRNVLGYMGDRNSSKERWLLAHNLVQQGISYKYLREEIFCQLMKQTTNNPNPDSLLWGWKLMCICVSMFHPTHAFSHYLSVYFEKHQNDEKSPIHPFVLFARTQFRETMKAGSRRVPPNKGEILSLEKGKNTSVIVIDMARGGRQNITVTTHTTSEQASSKLALHMGMSESDLNKVQNHVCFGLFETQFNAALKPPKELNPDDIAELNTYYHPAYGKFLGGEALEPDDQVLDTVSLWSVKAGEEAKRTASNDKFSYRLVFKPRLVLAKAIASASPAALQCYYEQCNEDVLRGVYTVGDGVAVQLAALQTIIECGRDDEAAKEALKRGLDTWFPLQVHAFDKMSNGDWSQRGKFLIKETLKARIAMLRDENRVQELADKISSQRFYMASLSARLPLFGVTVQRATLAVKTHSAKWNLWENCPKEKGDKSANELKFVNKVDIGVNEKGVFLMDVKDRKVIQYTKLNDVVEFKARPAYNYFYYVYNAENAPEKDAKVNVFTLMNPLSGKRLVALLQNYKAAQVQT